MKKTNNKGFSLVELIVVVAIMAVLVAMLAPQYLRYVERSRLQKDNSAISEVANAVKIAVANDSIYSELNAATPTTITATRVTGSGNQQFTFSATATDKLTKELNAVLGAEVVTGSTTYQKVAAGSELKITITKSSNGATVTVSNWVDEVADSPVVTTKTF